MFDVYEASLVQVYLDHARILCDVILDPLHFGGGNTSYEALGLGIPVVTLPSSYMRGRVTAACYHKMGLSDLIAETAADYVKRALRLANDRAFRDELRSRILSANHVLFEDRDSLHEIEDFLLAAVQRAARGAESRMWSMRRPRFFWKPSMR